MILSFLIFFLSAVPSHAEYREGPFCQMVTENLREGDLIFLAIDSPIFEQVALATQTWTSHVGVALFENGWVVAESRVLFSKKTPLCQYLRRTKDRQFSVRRYKSGLTLDQLSTLKASLNSQMGTLYNFGFDYDSPELFCSKMVYDAFRTIDIQVGELKTFRQLLGESPKGGLTFWQLWFWGDIPWNRRTITPKDQLIDDDFETILTSKINL